MAGAGGFLNRCRRILAAAGPGRQKTGPKAKAGWSIGLGGGRLSFGRGETVCHASGLSQTVRKCEFQFPKREDFFKGESILII